MTIFDLKPRVRLRVLPSLLPQEIELRNNGTAVQWRYVGQEDNAWTDLILLSEIAGEDGEAPAIVAGSGISIDSSDPLAPVVSTVSVRSYGAVGDGVTDDSAAFVAAIAAQSDLFVPPGTYYLGDTSVAITNKAFRLHGAGIGVSVLLWDDAAGGIAVEQDSADYHFDIENLSLWQSASNAGTALEIDGTGQRESGGTGIISDRTKPRFALSNVEMRGQTGPATDGWNRHVVAPGMHAVINGLHVTGQYGTGGEDLLSESGIELEQDTAAAAAEVVITNSWIFHTQVGVDVGEVEGVQISKTTIVGCLVGVFSGMTTANNAHLAVIDNHFNCYVSAVDVRNRAQLVITNNLFYTRGDAAGIDPIVVRVRAACDYSVISGNVFTENNPTLTATAIRLGETAATAQTLVTNNLFQGFEVGIDDRANASDTDILLNKYVSTVSEVALTGTNTRRRLDGAANPLLMVDGTSSLPGYAFQSDPDTGMYRVAANSLGWGAGGTELMRLDANGLGIGVTATPNSRLQVRQNTASANTFFAMQRLTRETTGTPSAGYGHGLGFEAETSSGNNELGAILGVLVTDFTLGSEDFDYVLQLMQNGAAAAERFRIKSTGQPIFLPPSSAAALGTNGEVTMELTNNTTLTFKARGSDGTTRSGTITLS